MLRALCVILGLLAFNSAGTVLADDDPRQFYVIQVQPSDKTQDVELDPLIQFHVSEKFDPATLNDHTVKLQVVSGARVPITVTGDLGGVVTVSVDDPLQPGQEYRLSVTAALRSTGGDPLAPFSVRFRTTSREEADLRADISEFQFEKVRLDRRDGVCGLAFAPRHSLFACTWDGKLLRYDLADDGTVAGPPALLLERARRFNAIVIDPASRPEEAVLWLSHDSQHRLSLGPNDFSGAISKVTVVGDEVQVRDLIVGLPTGDHPASGLTFGPDGRLYVSQGALSMLGGKPEVPETPLSAATLAVDLHHDVYDRTEPLDVRDFDAQTMPSALQVYATGIREAFDLCWHSSGHLYAGVNMNDTNERTPARPGLPAVTVRPDEMMLRIVEGKYYGHPNPSRNEWVLLGGNPTAKVDPWEVPSLPVGTLPEAHFDPSLLVRNLMKDKGPSADGVCEWTGSGPLAGRLIFCFYTATRALHTYALSPDGCSVVDHQPLVDAENRLLRFGAPLDVVFDPRGWLYVADFSAPERGDSGTGGGVWLARPAAHNTSPGRAQQ